MSEQPATDLRESPDDQTPIAVPALRDVLGRCIATRPHPQSYADAVLTSPDMQALKRWLQHDAVSDNQAFGVPIGQAMQDWKLSESFIEWALS